MLRGDHDLALRYLEETLEHLPALNRTRARLDPDFEALRADPRLLALIGDGSESPQAAPPSPGSVVS